MKSLIKNIVILLAVIGCSRVPTLGLQNHRYGQSPKTVVMIQIPGLSHSHLAMIKFVQQDARQRSSFGKMSCTGNMWSYNFYQIRPTLRDSMVSQLTGSKDIKGSCEDFDRRPVWDLGKVKPSLNFILESPSAGNSSLLEATKCAQGKFLKNASLISMSKSSKENDKAFHFQEKTELKPGVYFDKTCDGKRCFAAFSENVKSLIERLDASKNRERFVVLRNFEYRKFLEAKDIVRAKEVLFEVNSVLSFLLDWSKGKEDVLVLVTSSSPIRFELPARGKEWRKFEKNGNFVFFRKSDLWSPVYAYGAGAENFCGSLEESSVSDRIIWRSEKKELNLDILDAL